jgi:hypothetical protein
VQKRYILQKRPDLTKVVSMDSKNSEIYKEKSPDVLSFKRYYVRCATKK